jgi:hypothetical protein
VHDLREQRVRADLLGAHDEAAGLIDRTGGDLGARGLRHRHGLTGHHRLVHRSFALDQFAVHGDFLARPHPQSVTDLDGFDRHFFIALGTHAHRRLRSEVEQGLDGARGLLPRTQFEHLTEQHQHRDHRGGFEVDRHRAFRGAQRRGKELWRDGPSHAVEPRSSCAQRDQGEHVQAAVLQRRPSPLEEGPARPQYHRCAQHQLDPVGSLRAHQVPDVEEVPAHLQHQNRQRQDQPDPEPAGHVAQLGAVAFLRGPQHRFERHPADRATAWPHLPNLRVHRAGVLDFLGAGLQGRGGHSRCCSCGAAMRGVQMIMVSIGR